MEHEVKLSSSEISIHDQMYVWVNIERRKKTAELGKLESVTVAIKTSN